MKVTILTSLLIIAIFLVLSSYIYSIMAQNIEDEIGERALAISETIAMSPLVINAFNDPNPSKVIQPFTKQIQETIGAEFIVVGNENEIRYSHAIEDRIGKRMVGEDNERALQYGESYVSKQEGSLGLSVRGKSPIIVDGNIIGVVSVGFLLKDIEAIVKSKVIPVFIMFIIFLIVGIIGSMFIALHLKKLLYHMEPYEIAELLFQKEAILQSTKEGIIAVNSNNEITLLNQSAKEILQMSHLKDDEYMYQPLSRFADIPLLNIAEEKQQIQDREFIINQDVVLLNIFTLQEEKEKYGAVATFRLKTELEQVTKELSTIKQYADGLRAQSHEFSNKLHTILGLLQLGYVKEAMEFIRQEEEIESNYYKGLMGQIKDPVIHGLLIAKYNKAKEKGIDFILKEDSQLQIVQSAKYRDVILKVLGNVIDNAFYAVGKSPIVTLFITDIGNDIIIEIDDNGSGIDKQIEHKIFERGFTTKKRKGHGTGLFLVKQTLNSINGDIFLEESELNGTCFVIIIPKEKSSNGDY